MAAWAWFDEIVIGLVRATMGGTRRTAPAIGIVVFLVLLNLSSNAASAEIEKWGNWKWAISGVLPVALFAVWVRMRQLRKRIRLKVEPRRPPQACRGLIVFLSRAPKDFELAQELLASPERLGTVTDKSGRERFGGGWRMLWEALAYHLDRLECVLVIASGGGTAGTVQHFQVFRDLAVLYCHHSKPEVVGLHELPDAKAEFSCGVDFEDPEKLLRALEFCYVELGRKGIPDYEIMLDVTGGQKPASVVAGAYAMDRSDRRCEYVSTNTYEVMEYNITYVIGEDSGREGG